MKQWNKIYKNQPEKYEYYDVFRNHEDLPKIAQIFKNHKVISILDLGCGVGRNLVYLVKGGFELSGLDIAEDGIKNLKILLKKDGLKADVKVGNMYEPLPYEDNYFDAVISVQVLQHGKEGQIKKLIQEIERVLRPNGLIFVTVSGRISKGKVRYCLVKTAKKVDRHTYIPTIGDEKGLTHFIYDKKTLIKHFKNFRILEMWKDSKDYYCFLGALSDSNQSSKAL